ncbi:MAG: Obg family GTPase CgtA [Comamonadaceae bacterium]|nr:Obg family GTPase CgtA [Comamonadaceae bacterium]
MKVDTHPDNVRMRKLIEKHGFLHRGHLPLIYREGYELATQVKARKGSGPPELFLWAGAGMWYNVYERLDVVGMFIDEVRIKVKSGKGGDGIVAWRREKYIQFGGPAGGDGGRGGSVVFRADEGLSTLLDLRYRKVVKADDGEKGKTKNMHGADAGDIYVTVPVGTIVYEEHTEPGPLRPHEARWRRPSSPPADAAEEATGTSPPRATRRPRSRRTACPDISVDLRIELKLLADVGLIGFPSVGKSTLISVVSEAKPKIADYPFTTHRSRTSAWSTSTASESFVMADMPGIIEGASKGVGLGLRFLKHIERTRVIVHIIDMSAAHGRDPYEDYLVINRELAEYKFKLAQRPQILVANKMDMPEAAENLRIFRDEGRSRRRHHPDFRA